MQFKVKQRGASFNSLGYFCHVESFVIDFYRFLPHRDMGYKALWNEVKSVEDLCLPFTLAYFGAACVDYLSHCQRIPRNEESVIGGNVGGPESVTKNSTLEWWRKHCVAKAIYRNKIGHVLESR